MDTDPDEDKTKSTRKKRKIVKLSEQKRLKTEIMGLGPAERSRIKSFKAVHELDAVCALSYEVLT